MCKLKSIPDLQLKGFFYDLWREIRVYFLKINSFEIYQKKSKQIKMSGWSEILFYSAIVAKYFSSVINPVYHIKKFFK